MPYCVEVERDLDLPRSQVFKVLSDFGDIGELLPDLIDSVEVRGEGIGAERKIEISVTSGYPGQVVERLDASYDQRVFSYSMISNSSMPIADYVAVIRLEDTPRGGCLVRYSSNWRPVGLKFSEVKTMLEDFYNLILDAVEAQSELPNVSTAR